MSIESQLYEIRLKSDQFNTKLDQIESRMNGFENKIGGVGKTIAGVFGGNIVTSAFNRFTDLVSSAGAQVIKLGVDFEQTQVSFETMLGSAELANKVLKEAESFAAKTPFRFSEVVTGEKQLLAYGFGAETLTDNLTILGDVASGLSIPLGDLVYLYGTLKTQGKVMGKDMMQFAQRGIPIYDELSKILGVTKAEVSALVSDGKVSFEQIEQAFKNMTAVGSKFGGLMEKQSKTIGGRWSTFLDKLEASGRSLGIKMLPYLGAGLDKLNEIFETTIIPLFDRLADTIIEVVKYVQTIDFGQWLDPLSEIWDSFKGIYKSLSDLFNFDGIGGTFLSALRQLVKDTLLITESLTAVIEYTTSMANAAFTKAAGPQLSQAEYDEWRKTHSANDPLPTFEDVLKDRLSKAKNIWEGKNMDGTDKLTKSAEDSTAKSNKSTSSASAAAKKDASVGVEKVSSSTRNINISINELIHDITFSKTESWKETEAQLVERVRRALLTAVNDVNIVAQ